MSYQSFSFIAFSAIALLLYYVLGRKMQLWVLAAANVCFYLISGPKYLPFLLVTLVATYVCGLIIGSIYKKTDAKLAEAKDSAEKKLLRKKAKSKAKVALLVSFLFAIGLLVVCKYTNFIVANINTIFAKYGIEQLTMFKIILPLGISFYTFMAISYVLDVYWKRYKAEKNFLLYAVFLSYFPHVVQGPIDRFNEFKEQVKDGVKFNYDTVASGAQLVIWGLFKKLVVADRLGMFVDKVVGNWAEYDGFATIMAFIVYSIQIYADFSGCIDIVTGVSEAFGINLRKNFTHPYFSRTMAEFWRRWHISLQEWFKDYVYFPVSASSFVKSIKKKLSAKKLSRASELFAACFPILVVWLITGIWHGASWRFVAWGLFHATLLIGGRILEPVFEKLTKLFRINTDNFGWYCIQMARTFILCCIGRVFFRAPSFMESLRMFKHMFTQTTIKSMALFDFTKFEFAVKEVELTVIAVLVLLVADIIQEKMPVRKTLAKQNLLFRWAIIIAGILAVLIFGMYGPGFDASSFIYEQS